MSKSATLPTDLSPPGSFAIFSFKISRLDDTPLHKGPHASSLEMPAVPLSHSPSKALNSILQRSLRGGTMMDATM